MLSEKSLTSEHNGLPRQMANYKFRNCVLNTSERILISGFQYAELTAKTFDVLQCLVENSGELVTKDALLGKVWSGDYVEESNLPVHISKLRKILVETRENRFIETVQGVGYRFLAPVHPLADDEWRVRLDQLVQPQIARRESNQDLPVAVIPFRNETGDVAKDYLSDGLTEEVINGLSVRLGLKVLSRDTVFRFKGYNDGVGALKEVLRVAFIVTGRVRLADGHLTVAIELTNAENGAQIWGQVFSRDFSNISSIAADIVDAVSEKITSTWRPGFDPSPDNADSYKYYLMGRYFLAKRTAPEILRAIHYFEKSLDLSKMNLHSYVAIVESYDILYVFDCISRKEAVAKIKGILGVLGPIQDSVDFVQTMWGKLKLHFDWNTKAAESHARRALALNPNSIDAHYLLASIMALSKRGADCESHIRKMLTLDPLSMASLKRAGRVLCMSGQFDAAIALLNDAYEMEPSDFEALFLLGVAEAEVCDYDSSLKHLADSYKVHPYLETLSMIGYVEGRRGRVRNAEKIVRRMSKELKNFSGSHVNLARIHLALGNKEEAYRLLEKAFDESESDLVALPVDFRWKAIQQDTRFKTLVKKVRRPRSSFSQLV
jgi:DNA-binding winged helix-turn-helix (wHTH) protein/tetratricopeptide (TPR) repeat protein